MNDFQTILKKLIEADEGVPVPNQAVARPTLKVDPAQIVRDYLQEAEAALATLRKEVTTELAGLQKVISTAGQGDYQVNKANMKPFGVVKPMDKFQLAPDTQSGLDAARAAFRDRLKGRTQQ